MSVACLYVLGKCDCSTGRQFSNFDLTCKENSICYSLLIDVFGKVEKVTASEKVIVLTGGRRL